MRNVQAMSVGLAIVASTAVLSVSAFATGSQNYNDDLPVYLDRPLSASAMDTCTPGFIWQGAGNPNTTFQRKRNVDAGVELGIKGIIREGPDIRSTYVDGNGIIHIEVPAGAQPGNPNRAAWNFTYSYDVSLKSGNPSLDKYDAELWIDLDPSEKTKFLKLKLAKVGPPTPAGPCPREPDLNGYRWKSGNTTVIPDDEGTDKVTQNSQNYAFYAALIDTNKWMSGIQPYTFGPAQFDVVMKIKRKSWGWSSHHGHDHDDDNEKKETVLHVIFNVVTAPSQTP